MLVTFHPGKTGDQLVIASTDFDFQQAEEVEVVSVDGSKVMVKGKTTRRNVTQGVT